MIGRIGIGTFITMQGEEEVEPGVIIGTGRVNTDEWFVNTETGRKYVKTENLLPLGEVDYLDLTMNPRAILAEYPVLNEGFEEVRSSTPAPAA